MKLKVLIVEDDPMIVAILSEMVQLNRCEVSVALNFHSATEFLKETKFDLVITDFNFPGGDGNLVACLARHYGMKNIILHTGDPKSKKIVRKLYDKIYDKLDREMVGMLKAA